MDNQTTTDPDLPQCLLPKTSLVQRKKKQWRKLSLYCFCILIRHILVVMLLCYEHELKGVSNSTSPKHCFLSTRKVKSGTLKQKYLNTQISQKDIPSASSKVPTTPNYASHSDEIICSFFSQQASMPTTHDDKDLLQIDGRCQWEEIDFRWQVGGYDNCKAKGSYEEDREDKWISSQRMGSLLPNQRLNVLIVKVGSFCLEACRFVKLSRKQSKWSSGKDDCGYDDSNSKPWWQRTT
ncbi:hypothetical protein Tco_0039453 [Tanacetum coccineum]